MNSLSISSFKTKTIYLIILTTLFISLLPTTTAHASNNDSDINDSSVIGGQDIEARAYPWTVALIDNKQDDIFWAQYCGGTLISAEWVLTAAHCTFSAGVEIMPNEIDILAGQDELRATDGERISVERIIRHPKYNDTNGDSDIALIKLATPSVQPVVKIADASFENIDEGTAMGTVIGWGRTETNIRVNHLQQVTVPLVFNKTCTDTYRAQGYTVTNNMLCAGYADGGKDACSGDSGGPMVTQTEDETGEWVQIGVVSWGKGCGQADAYGVYTHLAVFKAWIDVQISPAGITSLEGTSTVPVQGQGEVVNQVFLPMVTR